MRLLSRNAEALFWLARYLERCASLARVIEMQSSFGRQDRDTGWQWLLALHSDEDRFKERFELTTASIVSFYVTDMSNPGSIRSSVHWARENARALRPFIPLEMWIQLNAFHTMIEGQGADDISPSQLPRTCAKIREGCLSQIGTAECTLYRDEGYRFFKLGLMIERADQTSRLLDVKFAQGAATAKSADSSDDFVFWSTILRTAAAYQVFNRLEPAGVNPERVARFLILNPSHPRSIGFCVREIDDTLQALRINFHLQKANKGLEACEVLTEGLQVAAQDDGLETRLHQFNDWIQKSLSSLTDAVSTAFFQTRPLQSAPEATPTPTPTPDAATSASTQKQEQQQS